MERAPDFTLSGTDGKTHTLNEHLGKTVVVYFYPKDDTPGCTQEACDVRDHMAELTERGAVVYGISRDSLASHAKFQDKYELNYILLSDPNLSTHEAYGVLQDGKTVRSTFLIDANGNIQRAWRNVKVDGHIEEVIQHLGNL